MSWEQEMGKVVAMNRGRFFKLTFLQLFFTFIFAACNPNEAALTEEQLGGTLNSGKADSVIRECQSGEYKLKLADNQVILEILGSGITHPYALKLVEKNSQQSTYKNGPYQVFVQANGTVSLDDGHQRRTLTCQTVNVGSFDGQLAKFRKAWDSFQSETPPLEPQPNCETRFYRAKSSVSWKGAVVLFHGYTACPQQYFELAGFLTAQGYDVALPRTPGHGQQLKNGKDQFDRLPDNQTWRDYESFVAAVNKVMALAPGKKIAGGLSLGGVLATLSVDLDPFLYDRLLVITPLYKLNDSFFTRVLRVGGSIPLLNSWVVGWGKECEETERQHGRAGICKFRIKHVRALELLGNYVLKSIPRNRKAIVQFVGVEKDEIIDSNLLKKAVSLFGSGNISFCLFPEGTNHSLISRYDTPFEDKFWLPTVLEKSTAFITRGSFFPKSGPSELPGVNLCALNP